MPDFALLGQEGFAALDSAVKLPQQTVGHKAAYPTILAKAAVQWCAIIKNHPFADGNKRVGTTALLVFLITNGYAPLMTDKELVEKALEIANTRGLPWQGVERWLRLRCLSIRSSRNSQDRFLRKRFPDLAQLAKATRIVRPLRDMFVH